MILTWRPSVRALAIVTLVCSESVNTPAQVTFESTVQELASKDAKVREKAVELLRDAAYPEAADALAPLIADSVDDIQLAAIGAELNIFLAQRITPKKRVGLVIERRGNLAADAIFAAGPSALGVRRVPAAIPVALAQATSDRTVRVAYEALYAFGALAGEVPSADRPGVLSRSAPMMAALLGSPDPTMRMGALQVIARVYAPRLQDPPLDDRLGDAVIGTLNSYENPVRETAMWALGAIRNVRSVQALSDLMVYYRKGPLAERAFDAIARIGHPASVSQIAEQLNSKDLTFRMLAIEGIARSGDRERHALVQAQLQRERHEALLLAGHFANAVLANGPVDAIVDALARGDLHDQSLQYVRELAPGRADVFSRLLPSVKREVRIEIIDALGLAGGQDAAAVLQAYSSDKDADIAVAAQRAIARLQH